MKALVLEKTKILALREIEIEEHLGPNDVRIKVESVGICGSDVHYYKFGSIGSFVVDKPMVLGHEASGSIIEVGQNVNTLKIGDRVCMEPGIPDLNSKASKLGYYNLDPTVRFWATPPIHGCLRENVVHPAGFTYKLPDNVSYDEGAMIEPFAVGLQAVRKASIKPGDIALVTGAGTIGLLTGMAAMAGGCSKVIITDIIQPKLDIAARFGMLSVNVKNQNIIDVVRDVTGGWGVNIVFEASGNDIAINDVFKTLCPGGKAIFIGMPVKPVPIDVVAAQAKEISMETIFRYANVFPSAISLISSGKIDVKPLVTDRYNFIDSIKAFEYAANPRPASVKVVIQF
jgi:D-xylulose reductase